MGIYYHITKSKWVPSIMSKGIRPGYRRGLNVSGRKCKKVYLTNDVGRIVSHQCGEKYVRDNDLVVLVVEIPDSSLEPVHYRDGMTYTISDFEFTSGIVHPSLISTVKPISEFKI